MLLRYPGQVWVTGPGGERWEVKTVLADNQTFGASPQTLLEAGQATVGGRPRHDRCRRPASDTLTQQLAVSCG